MLGSVTVLGDWVSAGDAMQSVSITQQTAPVHSLVVLAGDDGVADGLSVTVIVLVEVSATVTPPPSTENRMSQ